jgi:hypothetical protein
MQLSGLLFVTSITTILISVLPLIFVFFGKINALSPLRD